MMSHSYSKGKGNLAWPDVYSMTRGEYDIIDEVIRMKKKRYLTKFIPKYDIF